jgi:hypothetical protein
MGSKTVPDLRDSGLEAIFVPEPRDHPAGFGFRNYFAVENDAPAASSQVAVERVMK